MEFGIKSGPVVTALVLWVETRLLAEDIVDCDVVCLGVADVDEEVILVPLVVSVCGRGLVVLGWFGVDGVCVDDVTGRLVVVLLVDLRIVVDLVVLGVVVTAVIGLDVVVWTVGGIPLKTCRECFRH